MLSSSTADSEDTPSVGVAITREPKDADDLSEWPPLTNVADSTVLNDRAVDWLDHAYPSELNDIPTGTPKDVIWIVKESLDKERHRAPSVDSERKRSWRSSLEPKPLSIPPENRSASRRHHSVSHSSQVSSSPSENSNASSKSNPGYTVKMGPLGWIVVPDKTDDVPKKSKSTREGGLKKYLKDRNKSGECASCANSLSARYMVPLRCQHKYCHPCFAKLVSISMKHENIFPPKCCLEEIPVKTILSNLSRVLVDEYRSKEEEYSTPVSARWYCPSKPCGKWIPPTKLTRSCDTQRCPHCHVLICASCRALTHGKREGCPQDFGTRATPNEEETNFSRRCYRCQSTIELKSGYRSITCACSAQYCCICGSSSQLCSCTEIDVARWQEGIRTRRRGWSQAKNDHAQPTSPTSPTGHSGRRPSEQTQDSRRKTFEDGRNTHIADEKRIKEINGRIRFLRMALLHINKAQQTALITRHRAEGQELEKRVSATQAVFDKECNKLTATLDVNLKARKEVMATEQAAELEKMRLAHEEEEDETFMNLCRYLKNKPNREAREAGIIEKLKAAQLEERTALEEKHRTATKELEFNGSLELRGLISGMGVQRQEEQQKEEEAVLTFSRMVNIERNWFDAVVKKRNQMLEQLQTDLMDGELGVRGPSISPPRDSAVELPANEPVGANGRGHMRKGSEFESNAPLASKLDALIL